MQIDTEQLTELIADKAGMPKEQAGEKLDELIRQIKEAADKGQKFEIEDFGTFERVDQKLQFIPVPSLQTEINHKYAGMQPIELIGAFEDAPDEYLESAAETTEEHEQPEEPGEAKQDHEEQKAELETEDAQGGSSFTFDEDAPESDSEQVQEEFPGSESQKSDLEPEFENEKKEMPPHPASEPDPGQATAADGRKEPSHMPKTREKTKEADPIGRFLVAAVVVVAVGVSGWFVYDLGLLDSMMGNSEPVQTEQRQQNASATTPPKLSEASDDELPGRREQATEQNKERQVSQSARIAEQSKGSIFGLRGGAVPEAQGGYTIVVHSLRDAAKARTLRQELKSEGYLTILRSAEVGGATYWRVGLGQFKSLDDAKQAVKELPNNYRQNNFIRKFN